MQLSSPLTPEQVRIAVESDLARLLTPWMVGRSPTYTMDQTSKLLIGTGFWLNEQLSMICNDADRKTQCWKFNRLSRAYDMFEVAAEVMNEALEGNVEQNRKPHRRWG